MASVTLFVPGQEPMNFQDATELTLNQGTLMFFANKEDNETSIVRHITNMPFLWIE